MSRHQSITVATCAIVGSIVVSRVLKELMSEVNLVTCNTTFAFLVETLSKDETTDALVVLSVSR
jgi:hypothetical protein